MANEIYESLKSKYSGFYGMKKIWIFNNSVFVFDFEFNEVKFAVDFSSSEKSLRLVLRNRESFEFFKNFLIIGNEDEIFLLKNEKFIPENKNIIPGDFEKNIDQCFDFLIKKFNENYSKFVHNKNIEKIERSNIFLSVSTTLSPKVLGMMETLDVLSQDGVSLSRFGDGEFALIARLENSRSFQKNSIKLNHDLKEVLQRKTNNLLVAVTAPLLHDRFWCQFWSREWPRLAGYFGHLNYGDSFITRPEFFQTFGKNGVDKWKNIWNGKNICFIYGAGSRFDTEHVLFENIAENYSILSKPSNAFDDLERIISEVRKNKKYDIYLIALGQSATILAAKLHELGYRAIDIGHINASFDMVFNNGLKPEMLPMNNNK